MKSEFFITISQVSLLLENGSTQKSDIPFFLLVGVTTLDSIKSSEQRQGIDPNGNSTISLYEVKWKENFKFSLTLNYTNQLQNEYLTIQVYLGHYQKLKEATFWGDIEIDLYSLSVGPATNSFELTHTPYKTSINFQVLSIQLAETIFKPDFLLIKGIDCRDLYCEYQLTGEGHFPLKVDNFEETKLENNQIGFIAQKLSSFKESFTVCDFAHSDQIILCILKNKFSHQIISEFKFHFVQTYRNKDESKLAILTVPIGNNDNIFAKMGIYINNCPRYVQALEGIRYCTPEYRDIKNMKYAQGAYHVEERPVNGFDDIEPVCVPINCSTMSIDPFVINFRFRNISITTDFMYDTLYFIIYSYGFNSGFIQFDGNGNHFSYNDYNCSTLKTRHPYRLNHRYVILEIYDDKKEPLGEVRYSIHNLLSGPEVYKGKINSNNQVSLGYEFNIKSTCHRNVYFDLSNITVDNLGTPYPLKIRYVDHEYKWNVSGRNNLSEPILFHQNDLGKILKLILCNQRGDEIGSMDIDFRHLLPLRQSQRIQGSFQGIHNYNFTVDLTVFTNVGNGKGLFHNYGQFQKVAYPTLNNQYKVFDSDSIPIFEKQPCYLGNITSDAPQSQRNNNQYIPLGTNFHDFMSPFTINFSPSSLKLELYVKTKSQELSYDNLRVSCYNKFLLLSNGQHYLICTNDNPSIINDEIRSKLQNYRPKTSKFDGADDESLENVPANRKNYKPQKNIPKGIHLKALLKPINLERSYIGQSMLAMSAFESTIDEFDTNFKNETTRQALSKNIYDEVNSFYDRKFERCKSYIVCDKCEKHVNFNCDKCFFTLPSEKWSYLTVYCDCNTENTFIFNDKNKPDSYLCKNCGEQLPTDDFVDVDCLRCNNCGSFFHLLCPNCSKVPEDLFVYNRQICSSCGSQILLPSNDIQYECPCCQTLNSFVPDH